MFKLLVIFLALNMANTLKAGPSCSNILAPGINEAKNKNVQEISIFNGPHFKKNRELILELYQISQWIPSDFHALQTKFFSWSGQKYFTWLNRQEIAQLNALKKILSRNSTTLEQKAILEFYYEEIRSRRGVLNYGGPQEVFEIDNPLLQFRRRFTDKEIFDDYFITTLRSRHGLFGELIATLSIPDVTSFEVSIKSILNTEDLPLLDDLEMPEGLTPERLLSKKVDIIYNGGLTWAEVKYLGTKKQYKSVTGKAVFSKMLGLKRLGDLLDQTRRPKNVVLFVLGPGELSSTTTKLYEKHGIEVIRLNDLFDI